MAKPQDSLASRRSDLIVIASMAVIFILVALISNLEKALAFSALFGVFSTVIQTKVKGQRDRRFWIAISVLAVAHVIFLSLIYIPPLRFGLMALPVALVDGFAIWGIISWIDRRFPSGAGRSGTRS